MKMLNKDNYNDWMFKLIENELNIEDAKNVEQEINNNPFYKHEYNYWKQAILIESSLKDHKAPEIDGFLVSLEKKQKHKTIVFLKFSTAIAACIALFMLVYFQINNSKTTNSIVFTSNINKIEKHKKRIVPDKISKTINFDLASKNKKAIDLSTKTIVINENKVVLNTIIVIEKMHNDSILFTKNSDKIVQNTLINESTYKLIEITENILVDTSAILSNEKKHGLANILTNTSLRFNKRKKNAINEPIITLNGIHNASLHLPLKY